MIKKNFFLEKKQYSIIIGERNYLEYHVQHRKSNLSTRKRIYKGFQVSDDYDTLYKLALDYIRSSIDKNVKQLPASQLHDYIERHKYRYKQRTYEQFKGVCDRFIQWCKIQRITPHKITFLQCQQFITDFSVGKKNGTIFNNMLVLKTIYNGLLKEKAITENVWSMLPKIKRSPTSLMVFNSLQTKDIKQYCTDNNPQLLRAIHLVYSCAIRPNELRNLQIYDIDFERNLIEIKSTSAKNSKTQKIFLPNHVKKELSILQHYPPSYYVFGKLGVPGTNIISQNKLNDEHRKVLKALKINGRYALYSWKHTGTVAMVRAGINIKLIQQQLRHSSLDMTNEYLKSLGITDNEDLKNKMPVL